MTLKQQIKFYLEVEPRARERRNRYRTIWNIMEERYHRDSWNKDFFIEVGSEILSITRLINKVQEENSELQGEDYKDKNRLEQEVQVDLGYTPGYKQDLKNGRLYEPQENDID